MKILYQCEICGTKHDNKEGAEECEKKGLPKYKYAIDQEVYYDYDKTKFAKIKSHLIEKYSHDPLYVLMEKEGFYDYEWQCGRTETSLSPKA